jgi:hypothetical protein
MSTDRVSATRRITATAHDIFMIVSNPARHPEIDGSGMLQATTDPKPLTRVGQVFGMDMDRRPLGDIPNMDEYQVRNTVTRLVPDRLLEWTVRAVGKPPVGHVYGWEIDPVSDSDCFVTNYCDWTNVNEDVASLGGLGRARRRREAAVANRARGDARTISREPRPHRNDSRTPRRFARVTPDRMFHLTATER